MTHQHLADDPALRAPDGGPARRAKRRLDRYRASLLAGKVCAPVLKEDGTPWPVTYPYGVRSSAYAAGHHTGEDHACPTGSLCVAVSWGSVVYAGPAANMWGSAYGNQVVVRTRDGRYDYGYCHLSKIDVHLGQTLEPGQRIGLSGATGNVTGPHLHFEARPARGHYGSDIDPINVKALLSRRKG